MGKRLRKGRANMSPGLQLERCPGLGRAVWMRDRLERLPVMFKTFTGINLYITRVTHY